MSVLCSNLKSVHVLDFEQSNGRLEFAIKVRDGDNVQLFTAIVDELVAKGNNEVSIDPIGTHHYPAFKENSKEASETSRQDYLMLIKDAEQKVNEMRRNGFVIPTISYPPYVHFDKQNFETRSVPCVLDSGIHVSTDIGSRLYRYLYQIGFVDLFLCGGKKCMRCDKPAGADGVEQNGSVYCHVCTPKKCYGCGKYRVWSDSEKGPFLCCTCAKAYENLQQTPHPDKRLPRRKTTKGECKVTRCWCKIPLENTTNRIRPNRHIEPFGPATLGGIIMCHNIECESKHHKHGDDRAYDECDMKYAWDDSCGANWCGVIRPIIRDRRVLNADPEVVVCRNMMCNSPHHIEGYDNYIVGCVSVNATKRFLKVRDHPVCYDAICGCHENTSNYATEDCNKDYVW